MNVSEIMVWGSAFVVGYVYVGYPFLLWILTCFQQHDINKTGIVPTVTLLISAFNEEDSIRQKLQNSLDLDYPLSSLQVIVISDGSTDNTDRFVESFAHRGVELLRLPERQGKTVGLNAGVDIATGEILVFSDANILYEKNTIRKLVQNFGDPKVGCVTGDSQNSNPRDSSASVQEDFYWSYEQMIRRWESQIGNIVGGDGAILAIRRHLYSPLSSEMINDLVIPLQIVAKGYRAIFESEAVGFEPLSGSFLKEFKRKRRIVNRSWSAIFTGDTGISVWEANQFVWQIWSHKILRWLVLPMLVVMTIGLFLAYQISAIYAFGTWGIIGSLLLAGIGFMTSNMSFKGFRFPQAIFYFYLINLAAILGITAALRGNVEVKWVPERN